MNFWYFTIVVIATFITFFALLVWDSYSQEKALKLRLEEQHERLEEYAKRQEEIAKDLKKVLGGLNESE